MTESITTPIRKPKFKIKKAPRYGVVFFNNDVTGMDQVIYLLTQVFNYTNEDARSKMFEIHDNDKSFVFTGSKEACDMKNDYVKSARKTIMEENLEHKVEKIDDEEE